MTINYISCTLPCLQFKFNPFKKRSIGPLNSIEAQATKVGATIQAQASHIETAAPAFISSAITAAETAASIPFQANAGITEVCIGLAETCSGTGTSFQVPMIALVFGFIFVFVSIVCQIWAKKSIFFSAASLISSFLAWILSILLLGITEGLYKTAQRVNVHTDGDLEHGFVYTGSWVNFVLICFHLVSCIGIFAMDFKDAILYNNRKQSPLSDYGKGRRKLREYGTQEKISSIFQRPESVWKPL